MLVIPCILERMMHWIVVVRIRIENGKYKLLMCVSEPKIITNLILVLQCHLLTLLITGYSLRESKWIEKDTNYRIC